MTNVNMIKYAGNQVFSLTPDFIMSAALGKIDGVEAMRKFASLPNVAADTERDIWDFGSDISPGVNIDYDYPADETAPITTISSSDVDDTGVAYVEGLDINGVKTILNPQLEGQDKVTLATPLWRSYRASNLMTTVKADRSAGFEGQIYVYEDTDIVAGVPTDKTKVHCFMDNGNNSSLMSQYCCPAGFTGLFLAVEPRVSRKTAATIIIRAYVRNYGQVFRLVDVGALSSTGSSTFAVLNYIPIPFVEKSDLVITAESDTNNVGASVVYYILLFNNIKWGIEAT